MNKYGALAILALFLFVGGAISYDNITNGEGGDAIVVTESTNDTGYLVDDSAEEMTVEMYYYAVETFDGVLIPLAFASEVITDDDENQFVMFAETIFPQIEYEEIEKGAEMLMIHINKNRTAPVYVEIIRVSE